MLFQKVVEIAKNTPQSLELVVKVTTLIAEHLSVDKVNFLVVDEQTKNLESPKEGTLVPIQMKDEEVQSAWQIFKKGVSSFRLSAAQHAELQVAGFLLVQALENIYMKEQVIVDKTTKLYNRSFLDRSLADEISRSKRYRTHFSLILLEFTGFERIRETYGVDAAHATLALFAKTLRDNTKDTDLVFCYSDAQFAVIALSADERGSMGMAERLKHHLEAILPSHESLKKILAGPKVTISIRVGAATYSGRDKDQSVSALIEAAEQSLARSRQEGQGRLSADPSGATLKMLIVDDEKMFTGLLADYFKKRDFAVTVANSGHEALQLLEKENFHLMVLDMRMPGMSGLEVLERIPRQIKKMKVVVLSAVQDEVLKKMTYDYGVCDYLEKPILMESLSKKLMMRVLEMQA